MGGVGAAPRFGHVLLRNVMNSEALFVDVYLVALLVSLLVVPALHGVSVIPGVLPTALRRPQLAGHAAVLRAARVGRRPDRVVELGRVIAVLRITS